MQAVFAVILILLGATTLFVAFNVVNNPLNIGSLSMNPITKVVKEHGKGLSWKWFFSKIQGGPIDMRSNLIITSGGILMMDWDKFIKEKVYEKIAPRIYETKDGILYGSWAAAIRPLKGHLLDFMMKTPQVGALISMSKVDLTISDYLANQETEKSLSQKKVISDMVAKVFGGDHYISRHEKTYGLIVSDPQLFDLNLGKKSQDAAEKLFEVKKFQESMKLLENDIKDPEKRQNAIFFANGAFKKNVYEIEGMSTAVKYLADGLVSIFTKKK